MIVIVDAADPGQALAAQAFFSALTAPQEEGLETVFYQQLRDMCHASVQHLLLQETLEQLADELSRSIETELDDFMALEALDSDLCEEGRELIVQGLQALHDAVETMGSATPDRALAQAWEADRLIEEGYRLVHSACVTLA